MKILAFLLMFSLVACTVVERTYHITIYVSENSIVEFNPEIVADIIKDKEIDTDITTEADGALDLGIIP